MERLGASVSMASVFELEPMDENKKLGICSESEREKREREREREELWIRAKRRG